MQSLYDSLCRGRRNIPFAAIGVALVLAMGCSRNPLVPMSGAVTLNGQPLSDGTLTLTPVDRNAAPSTGSAVENGRYQITAAKGPRRGLKYRVEISAMNVPPGFTVKPGEYPTFQDKIPVIYNRESTLTVAIPAEATSMEHDFALSSSGKPVK